MNPKCLDYRTLPGQNRLLLSYLFEPEKVGPFYPTPVNHFSDLTRLAETVHKRPRIDSDHLYSELADFHYRIGAGRKTIENLQALKSESAVAVVTGQQVGLLGGPALTVYKALTAVRLAADLTDSGVKSVPVFWIASQDSDFDEIRSTYTFSKSGELSRLKYPDHRETTNQMVGTIGLKNGEQVLAEFREVLGTFDGKNEALEPLVESYGKEDFRTAFARWLIQLFNHYGLVILDPLIDVGDPGEVYRIAIQEREEILERLHQRSNLLVTAGYPVQVNVPVNETLLFLVEGNNRFKLTFDDGVYCAKGLPDAIFTPGQLIRKIDLKSVQLSPSALLRPILQDYLLPTLVTVGGPAEIAYFGQLNAVNDLWKTETPVVSRCGFTLVDRKAQRFLKKWGLSVEQVLTSSHESIVELVLREGDLGQILDEFESTEQNLQAALMSLERSIQNIDPTVASMLNNSSRKIFYQLKKVSKRLIANREIRDSNTSRQISYLTNQLLPQKQLQERIVNFASFYEHGGIGLLDKLLAEANPFERSHNLFYL